jgi:hypothetical protein
MAPASRSGLKKPRTEVEPPVFWKPSSGLAKRRSSGGAATTVTWLSSTSSSSAISMDMAGYAAWPVSTWDMVRTIAPFGSMRTTASGWNAAGGPAEAG